MTPDYISHAGNETKGFGKWRSHIGPPLSSSDMEATLAYYSNLKEELNNRKKEVKKVKRVAYKNTKRKPK